MLFWLSQILGTPKVGVHRENLLIGNVAQTVFGGFYICWDYVISFSQHFPMRKFSPSPPTSPSPLSHWNSENWLKFGKIFFFNFSQKDWFFFKTYIKEYVLGLIFMIVKIIFLIFFNFLRIFEKKYPIFLKSMTKIAPLPQPNFSIWLRFLTIFHQPWTPGPWWKIAKSVIFCSSWPVETVLSKFSKNLFFDKLEFSLNIAVLMHPNGPKCLKND